MVRTVGAGEIRILKGIVLKEELLTKKSISHFDFGCVVIQPAQLRVEYRQEVDSFPKE